MDSERIVNEVAKMGIPKGSEKWELEVLRKELKVVKEQHDSERTAARWAPGRVTYLE